MKFTRETIESLAKRCDRPTGDPQLDGLYDEYNADSGQADGPNYYRFLYRLSRRYPGLTMVELGCKYGVASLHFLRGGGKHSTAIDCGNHLRRNLFSDKEMSFNVCTSTSLEAMAAAAPFGSPDVVLVDTDHSHGTTWAEFKVWRELLAPGGVMLFDDIGAYRSLKRDDFGCGLFWEELNEGTKIDLPQLHVGGWGFGAWLP